MMKEFTYRFRFNEVQDVVDDVAIECSKLPKMYLRIIQQFEETGTPLVLIAIDECYFNTPRMKNLADIFYENLANEE